LFILIVPTLQLTGGMLRVRDSYFLFSYLAIQTAAPGTLLVLGNDIDGDYLFLVSGLFYVSFLCPKRLILSTYITADFVSLVVVA
jgi:hypothetical protein